MGYAAYTDGACRGGNPGRCASAFVVYEDGAEIFRNGALLPGVNSNNFAEYTGLINFLVWAHANGIKNVSVFSDSKLVVCQVNSRWKVRDSLIPLCFQAQRLMQSGGHTITHVRGHSGVLGNEIADEICNEVLDLVSSPS